MLFAMHLSKTVCTQLRTICFFAGSVFPGCRAVDADPIRTFSAEQSLYRLDSLCFLSHLSKMPKCPWAFLCIPGHRLATPKPSSREEQAFASGMSSSVPVSAYHSVCGSQAGRPKGLQRIWCCLCPEGSTILRLFNSIICSDVRSKKPQ